MQLQTACTVHTGDALLSLDNNRVANAEMSEPDFAIQNEH